MGIDICGDPHQPTVTPYLLPALKEPFLFYSEILRGVIRVKIR